MITPINMIDKSKIYLALNIFGGFIISLYFIYIRLIVVKLPKELYFIENYTFKYPLIIFSCCSLIIMLFVLIKNIRVLLQEKKEIKTTLFGNLIKKINTLIESSLIAFYYFIMSKIPDIYDKTSFITQKFYAIFKNKTEAFFILFALSIKLIIVILFLIDVFFFFKLQYMYKGLFLLTISLCIKIFFFILKDFASNLSEISSSLNIIDKGIDESTQLPLTAYSLKDPDPTIDLDYSIGQYILCSKITGYLEIYDRYDRFFTPRFNILIYSLYVIGWIYIFYINLIYILF